MSVRNLAAVIAEVPVPGLVRRTATVAAVNLDGTLDLTWSTGDLISSVPQLAGCPAVGDPVILLGTGDAARDYVVVGPVATSAGRDGIVGKNTITSGTSLGGSGVPIGVAGSNLTVRLNSTRQYTFAASGLGCQSTVTNDSYAVSLMMGGTAVTQVRGICYAGWAVSSFSARVPVTGSGDILFWLQVQRLTGTGTLTLVAAAGAPTVMLVEDAGPA